MNGPGTKTCLLAGAAAHGRVRIGLLVPDEPSLAGDSQRLRPIIPQRGGISGGEKAGMVDVAGTRTFIQPVHFNRSRYKRIVRMERVRRAGIGLLLTLMVLMMLAWKAAEGAAVSDGRWLLGAASGLFFMLMLRLVLFVSLSAPHFIRFKNDVVHLSGLGILRPCDIAKWTLERDLVKARHRHCAHLEISFQREGSMGMWSMWMDEGREADCLQGMLKTVCTVSGRANKGQLAVAGTPARQQAGAFVPLRT